MGIWIEKILDMVYPNLQVCVGCLDNLEEGYLCQECSLNISFNRNCDKIYFDKFEANYASYYSGTIKNVIYNFKVNKNFRCGEYLCNILFDYITSNNMEFDYLSYVPRDKDKVKREGFDQSRFLCKSLSKKLGVPFLNLVSCSGKRFDQKHMNVVNRKENVKGKFFVSNNIHKVNHRSVLIIDDVATTYGTVNEVVGVVKKSTSKTEVSVLTIAKTLI